MAAFSRALALGTLCGAVLHTTAQTAPQCTFGQGLPSLTLPCRFYVPLPSGAHPSFFNAVGDTSECGLERTDETIENCGGSFNVIHTWSVLDSTSPTGKNTAVQTIQVTDTTPPTLDNLPASTVHYCAETGPPPVQTITATDPCSAVTILPYTEWTVGDRTDRQYGAKDDCDNLAVFTQMLYPDGVCPTPAPTSNPTAAPTSPSTTATSTTLTRSDDAVGQPLGTTVPTATTTISALVRSGEDNDAADNADGSLQTDRDGGKGGKGSKDGDVESTLQPESTSEPLEALGKGGKRKHNKKHGKKKHGNVRSNAQLDVVQHVSIAGGVIFAVVVVAGALWHRRKTLFKDLTDKEPLMRGGSSADFTSDGLTYAYASCA